MIKMWVFYFVDSKENVYCQALNKRINAEELWHQGIIMISIYFIKADETDQCCNNEELKTDNTFVTESNEKLKEID